MWIAIADVLGRLRVGRVVDVHRASGSMHAGRLATTELHLDLRAPRHADVYMQWLRLEPERLVRAERFLGLQPGSQRARRPMRQLPVADPDADVQFELHLGLKSVHSVSVTALLLAVLGSTWANPLDIDYRYSYEQLNESISYRTGADPVIVRYHDAYYLFATLAPGYWMSKDLGRWQFVKADVWPLDQPVAAAVAVIDDKLFLTPSAMVPAVVLFSTNPGEGHWQVWTRLMPPLPPEAAPGPWDPDLFLDDDGKTYLYWGSSNLSPIFGARIDLAPADAAAGEGKRLQLLTTPAGMVHLDPANRGWHRFGWDHGDEETRPFIEGAWMTRHGDRYYLQYAAPGTENNAYATGVAVGDAPLGPFVDAPYNPIGYKPGGFVIGAGHGSTFEDAFGNFWNTGTAWVGANWPFERRVGMYPAGFHDDGQMWVDTRFGDFPHRVPDHRLVEGESTFTGWMLLSYRKPAKASSSRPGHPAPAATDENPRTAWVSERNSSGETLTVDLGSARMVNAVQVCFGDVDSGRYGDAPDIVTRFRLEGSRDGHHWETLADLSRATSDRANAYFELASAARLRFVRYVHGVVGARTLAISDIRVFGSAGGTPPSAPVLVSAQRERDGRNAIISWKPVPHAVGYNVRWGLTGGRLHSTYEVFADAPTTLTLRSLTRGVTYVVAVEAFDESGVSTLSRTMTLAP